MSRKDISSFSFLVLVKWPKEKKKKIHTEKHSEISAKTGKKRSSHCGSES